MAGNTKTRWTIALGGGGARGIAHLGVLAELEDKGIPLKAVAGSSMGAIVGGLYAYFGNVKEASAFLNDLLHSKAFEDLNISVFASKKRDYSYFNLHRTFQKYYSYSKFLHKQSVVEQEKVVALEKLLPKAKIEELKMPFYAIATDYFTGEEYVWEKGSLAKAIISSASIPGVFPPQKKGKYLLIDGGVCDLVPVHVLKDRYPRTPTIAVDVERDIHITKEPSSALEVLRQSEYIQFHHLNLLRMRHADVVIRPEVRKYTWADFNRAKCFYEKGVVAAHKKINAIRKY
jgi:NTE family protein